MSGTENNDTLLPVFLDLREKSCLVVGGGSVALRKLASLITTGAHCTVIAPHICDEIDSFSSAENIILNRRAYLPGEAGNYYLIYAATDNPAVNAQVYDDAQKNNCLVNSVDDPQHCTFFSAATLRRGQLQIAVSTGGSVPGLAKKVKKRIDSLITSRYEDLLTELEALRNRLKQSTASPEERMAVMNRILESDEVEEYLAGNTARFTKMCASMLKTYTDTDRIDAG